MANGKWVLHDLILLLGMGQQASSSRVGYVPGYSRIVFIPGGGTTEPRAALKRGNDESICWCQADYVHGGDDVMSRLRGMDFNVIIVPFFWVVNSRDEPVRLDVVVCESELGSPSRETIAMQIAKQGRPCRFPYLSSLDYHLREIAEDCFKSASSVKGFHGIINRGHADGELCQLVEDVRTFSWELMSNTQSNRPKSLIQNRDLKSVGKIWAGLEHHANLFLDRFIFRNRRSLSAPPQVLSLSSGTNMFEEEFLSSQCRH